MIYAGLFWFRLCGSWSPELVSLLGIFLSKLLVKIESIISFLSLIFIFMNVCVPKSSLLFFLKKSWMVDILINENKSMEFRFQSQIVKYDWKRKGKGRYYFDRTTGSDAVARLTRSRCVWDGRHGAGVLSGKTRKIDTTSVRSLLRSTYRLV